MKRTTILSFLGLLILCLDALPMQAAEKAPEAPVADAKEIVGSWHLEGKSLRLDQDPTKEDSTWTFTPDGKMAVEGFNPVINEKTRIEDTYEIKEGRIHTKIGGKYKRVRSEAKQMVLEGSFGFFYLRR
jgi:hypothetical protein